MYLVYFHTIQWLVVSIKFVINIYIYMKIMFEADAVNSLIGYEEKLFFVWKIYVEFIKIILLTKKKLS